MRWLLLIWLLFPFAAHAEGPVRLDVAASAIAVDKADLVLALRLDGPAPYRVFLLDDPKRLVIDMEGLELADADAARIPGATAMEAVRAGPFRPGWGRMVFQLPAPYAVIEAVQQTGDTGATLRLRLSPVAAEDFAGAPNAMSALWDLPQPTTPASASSWRSRRCCGPTVTRSRTSARTPRSRPTCPTTCCPRASRWRRAAPIAGSSSTASATAAP